MSEGGVFLSPVPSQLSSVAGMDLPAAMEEENEVNSGSLTLSVPAAYTRSVQNSQWFPQTLPMLPSSCRSGLTGAGRGAQHLPFPEHPAATSVAISLLLVK